MDPTKREEWIRKISETKRGTHHTDSTRRKISDSRRGIRLTDETRLKMSKSKCGKNHLNYGKRLTDDWRLKMSETHLGGFWYGNVRYRDRNYCELWCRDLWKRIDKAQNYQSILSGKTRKDNVGRNGKSRALSRHHVYWQPKACCEWDEDLSGYYAWIDIGIPKKPNKIKYYIKGDPNKFVLLTMSEHLMIATDKLKWIKIFEELIETKLDGVCYLPKEAS